MARVIVHILIPEIMVVKVRPILLIPAFLKDNGVYC